LWKVPFKGGPPVRVTKNGGLYAIESEDERFLYYAKFEQPGIWKMPIAGADETRVLDQSIAWFNWALTRDGIYFLSDPSDESPHREIRFLDFATGKTVSIFTLEKSVGMFGGLAVSPDHKSLLYNQVDFSDSYLMLVKNFG
jgi:hypothetical protein